nr:ribonuclease H-like domain-containing protein [Tanacetum cinerariifolium]
MTKVKTVNGEEHIQALVDKNKVITIETSVRSNLHLEDAEDEHVTTTSNDLLLSGRNDQDMFDTSILDVEKVVAKKEINAVDPVTIAGEEVTTAGVETSKPKSKGIVIQDPSETPTPTPIYSSQQSSKAKMIEPEKPLKRKDPIMIDKEWIEAFVPMYIELVKGSKKAVQGNEKAQEGSSKRAADKLEQEDAKRQRIEKENESTELKFQVTPKTSHLQVVKRIFRYLKGQPKMGLWYPKVSSFDLEAYSDSDYAVFHSKTKHIEIRHHFIRDAYEKKLFQVLKIHTDDNVADLLTKAFDVSRLRATNGTKLVSAARFGGIGGSGGDQVNLPHDSPLLGGHTFDRAEGSLNLEAVSSLCTNLSNKVLALETVKDAQAKEILTLKGRIKKLEKRCKPSISHHRAWLRSVSLFSKKKKLSKKKSISKQGRKNGKSGPTKDGSDKLDAELDEDMEYIDTEEAVNEQELSTVGPTTTPTTTTIFDDEEITLADTLIKIKDDKAKGVAFKDSESTDRPARSILTLKPLPTIDPKDKGKGVLEEPESAKKRKEGSRMKRMSKRQKTDIDESGGHDRGEKGLYVLVLSPRNKCKELASPKQTDLGKDNSNPLIVDSLLKTRVINAPCYCNETLATAEQTATRKEISNPFMAGTTASSSNIQNVAFVSAKNTSNTNDFSTTYSVSSPSVSESHKEGSSSYIDEVIHSFFANQTIAPQQDYDDLEHINNDDMEDIDLKWAKGNQDNRRRDAGYNGNKTRDNGSAQNYAMMAYSSSNSGSNNESVFINKASDLEDTPVNDRFADGLHAVPPSMTGNYIPSGPDDDPHKDLRIKELLIVDVPDT